MPTEHKPAFNALVVKDTLDVFDALCAKNLLTRPTVMRAMFRSLAANRGVPFRVKVPIDFNMEAAPTSVPDPEVERCYVGVRMEKSLHDAVQKTVYALGSSPGAMMQLFIYTCVANNCSPAKLLIGDNSL
jgi:antitoxin component of RelBE/YafQ-DinJ toxin-antitoxin module